VSFYALLNLYTYTMAFVYSPSEVSGAGAVCVFTGMHDRSSNAEANVKRMHGTHVLLKVLRAVV